MLARPGASSATTAVAGLPEFLSGRQPIALPGAGMLGGTNLADLEGSLPREELMEAKASVAIQWMLRHPKLCYMASAFSDDPPLLSLPQRHC